MKDNVMRIRFRVDLFLILMLALTWPVGSFAQGKDSTEYRKQMLSQIDRLKLNVFRQEVDKAHEKELNKTIFLNKGTQKFIDVLKTISQQIELKFSYSEQIVPNNKKIVIRQRKLLAKKAISRLLESTDLGYVVSDNQLIIIKVPKKEQLTRVSGTVVDGETGDILPGVNITVKGTTRGTFTDTAGYYRLQVPSLQDTLVFSYIGYKKRVVPIKNRKIVNVLLRPKAITGEQMVVVGYGEQKKKDLTESVSTVDNEELMKSPAINVGNMLSGKATGLTVTQGSGLPGGDRPELFIRGINSLNGANSRPLYIVDGVRRDLFQLDPENIKSISVLKGPAATAIYGIEGANGVILVKTKRGKKGPAKISVNMSAGLQRPTNLPDFAGSYQYAKLFNRAQMEEGTAPSDVRFTPKAVRAFKTGAHPLVYPNTDWVDYMTKPAAYQTRNSISVSGGTDDVKYFVSGGFLKQDGLFRTFNSTYDFNPSFTKYNFRTNLDVDATSTTRISLTSYGRVGKRIRTRGGAARFGDRWRQIFRGAPFAGAGIVDGKLVSKGFGSMSQQYIPRNKQDPFLRTFGNGYNDLTHNVLNVDLSVRQKLNFITKDLYFQAKGSYNTDFQENKYRNSSKTFYIPYFKVDRDPSVQPGAPGDSTIVYRKLGNQGPVAGSENFNNGRHWYIEARLHYQHSFGPHQINALILGNQRKTFYPSNYTGIARGLTGLVGRVNYNYKDRYLFEGNMGYNGSENFAKGRRFGFFPSVSGGWIMTNEPFMKNVGFLNYLKLSATYGLVGNDQGVGRFLYLPTVYQTPPGSGAAGYNYGYNIPQNEPAARQGAIGNPLVHWETAHKQNYAIDLRLLRSRLTFHFEYFRNHRTDILTNLNTTPAYVSANLPATNTGEVENQGFESRIKWRQSLSSNFSYHVNTHVSFARNKILNMNEVHRQEPYLQRTGHSIATRFGYIFDGFFSTSDFQTDKKNPNFEEGDYENADFKPNSGIPDYPYNPMPGDMKYKDLNGDGKVTAQDQRAMGYPDIPEYTFGATIGFHYKNFEVSTLWKATAHVTRTLRYEPYRTGFGPGGQGWWSLLKWQADGAWTPEKGQNATYPRLSTTIAQRRNSFNSDFWTKNAAYLRLKNVNIAYNLPSEFLNNFGIKNMRIYVSGQDLLTFSKLKKYSIDPESHNAVPGRTSYPIMKVYNFGINVDF